LIVLGNVVRVSHGKTVSEVLGDSDGITPFLRFSLKKSPLTYLPEATGAVPALEVRVNDVLWTMVSDFADSGPEDRHYIVQRDESQVSQVVFGDGRKGAIPSSGQRNIRATYRVGLGRIGNIDAEQLSRLEKAHPLIKIARNPLPISGGTEPAALDQIRFEATRFIRTFDRAVSASDYADLALLFPGIARAEAASMPNSGVTLVVADADGHALADETAFKRFIDARRDPGVPLDLKKPFDPKLFLHVRIEFEHAFFDWQIDRAVRGVLCGTSETAPGLFTFRGRQMGEPAFLSRVYEVIQAIPGVVFVQIIHFDLISEKDAGTSIAQDSIRVATYEWLSLPPNNLIIDTSQRSDV
ncbi:MAG TPA: putative baseplate assembly protein, partial [Polyangiaceae bacterium]